MIGFCVKWANLAYRRIVEIVRRSTTPSTLISARKLDVARPGYGAGG
jgi:hypothetical protein